MKKIFLLILLISCVPPLAFTQYWQQRVDYAIEVQLNDKEHTLDGFEKITYVNNSPDTLTYIWFHLWPNAYKNDRTALTDQLLKNNDTRLYFANKNNRGYINRLNFAVNNVPAKTEDHPEHIDIIKLVLPTPLPPSATAIITTPFHVKLPYNFSRGGHVGQTYQLTQWYPKPAVYDTKGWHPIPYLDQGEFYSEFGTYEVKITLPKEYVVAATGQLQTKEELAWLKTRIEPVIKPKSKPPTASHKKSTSKKPLTSSTSPRDTQETKTLRYIQENVHDFALFANKDFIVNYDTCALPSGKVIDVFTYYTPSFQKTWKNSLQYCKDAVRFYSTEVGPYAYDIVSAVQGPESFAGGMEYPTITLIAPVRNSKELDIVLAHEIGHNWFYGILASNERLHPWLDEGINTFYEYKYTAAKYKDYDRTTQILYETAVKERTDQPITTPAEEFSSANYGLIAYHKTAEWLQLIEKELGKDQFREVMQLYFQKWKFRHPQPEDFKNHFTPVLGDKAEKYFKLLYETGSLPRKPFTGFKLASPLKPGTYAAYVQTPSQNLFTIAPGLGYNRYDRWMIGAVLTNLKLPPSNLQFFLAPLYSTGAKQLNGIGTVGYSIYSKGWIRKTEIGLSGMRFSRNADLDTNSKKVFERFSRFTPSIRLTLRHAPRESKRRYLEGRSILIEEQNFAARSLKEEDGLLYVSKITEDFRYINQLSFVETNNRELYPYYYMLQLEQGKGFYRLNATGNYFFNYAEGGGLNLRFFAAKFGYINKKENIFSTFLYQPKLLGVTGEEDYTYSNYFLGRTASYGNDGVSALPNSGFPAQQIMIRDGGLKLRIDQHEFLQGRSQNWVAALNFNTTLPEGLFPVNLPVKLFFDLGTHAEAWRAEEEGDRFLYVGGVQLSLFKNLINVYAPLVYNKEIRNTLKTLPERNTFGKRLTFSLDIHQSKFRPGLVDQLFY